MENWRKILIIIFRTSTLCLLLGQASCGGDDAAPSETDRVRGILKGAWKVQTVRVDDTDQTTRYKNLTLTFTDANYSTTDGAPVWPAAGGWTFTDETGKAILRSDDVIITVEEATASTLVLRFDWDTTTIGPGRIKSIQGEHVFTFEK
jgi:hypothetical protein